MKIEHLITIKGKSRTQEPKRKWPVDPSDRSKLLMRRRSSGIRFYDLGYMLVGDEYVNLPFVDPHAGEDIDTTAEHNGVAALTLSYFDQIRSLILAVPQEDWTTTFKQINNTYTQDYGTTFGDPMTLHYRGQSYFLSDTTVWDGSVFRPNNAATTDDFTFDGVNRRLFMGIRANTASAPNKITTEPDFAADDATFMPSRSMDVFLVPALIDVQIEHTHDYTIHPLFPELVSYSEEDALDNLRFIYPREVLHDDSLEVYGEYLDGWHWSRAPYPLAFDTPEAYAEAYRMVNYWKTFGGLRAGRIESPLGGPFPIYPISVADFQPEATFPAPPGRPPGTLGVAAAASTNPSGLLSGILLGVIKQGGQFYYLWRP